jgi:hypothetical protein
MKQSWLIVQNISKDHSPTWELTKTVFAIGSKAKRLALEYQDELNEGRNMEQCIKENKDYISVCPIPWNQARDYTSQKAQRAIKNAKEYKGKAVSR